MGCGGPREQPRGPGPAARPCARRPLSSLTPHLANIAAVSFPKTAASPGFVESLKSFCPAPVGPHAPPLMALSAHPQCLQVSSAWQGRLGLLTPGRKCDGLGVLEWYLF